MHEIASLPGKVGFNAEVVNGLKISRGPIPESFSVQHVVQFYRALLQGTTDVGQPFGRCFQNAAQT